MIISPTNGLVSISLADELMQTRLTPAPRRDALCQTAVDIYIISFVTVIFFVLVVVAAFTRRSSDDASHKAAPTLTFSFRMHATLMAG